MDDANHQEPGHSTKGHIEQMSREEENRELISSDSESSDDGGNGTTGVGKRRQSSKLKWWFQHREVRSNCLVVLGAWLLVCLSIVCFGTGIILEILYHTGTDAVFRGFILMIVGVALLIPSGYAVTHVYLAAKKVGRVRMESVWFFT